ncbi:BCCT family transporter [Brachybacterium paraconglomeratum]|uniref:BCCT family transporter n=2 Tax=Brachybacterium TaxID=43668 RepID=A0A3R8S145_9MICO|nr:MULTISPECIES: BCCT family transporter [Brachybacterium]RRR20471.1 BCCT family transporter [Brachybacterium paraconglomeratum]GLI32371.1 choline transporter [Brachybacterium conglomeratum]GLK03904.1 choline transporter [Brachybacterium conglomeratum]
MSSSGHGQGAEAPAQGSDISAWPEELPRTVHLPRSQQIATDDSDDEITEKLRRQGARISKGTIAPAVFWPAMVVVLGVALLAIVFPETSGSVMEKSQNWIVANLGWFYMLAIGIFVAFAIIVALSRWGSIRLGRDDDEPEFGLMSWFAMLFSAGMGVGLVFYGVAEPLGYTTNSPKPGWDVEGAEASGLAMAQTFLHWGLHPWAAYAVIGLAIAYAMHRRGRPVSIRWALEPIFGDRVKGWIGDVIDVLAIFGTVFGIATSLGLGAQQIAAGMQVIGLVDEVSTNFLVILIVVITFIATLSVVSGVGVGIKWLSNGNLTLAGLLAVAALLFGPTVFIFQNFVESLGIYLSEVFHLTLDVGAYTRSEEAQSWFAGNTLFYWGWWIAWAPFVGVFIARISKGRTVRQFVAGVLLVPTLVGMIWFSIWGGNGLFRQWFGTGDLGDITAEESMFRIFEQFPATQLLSVLGIIVVAVFFITSSDSGSLVVDMLASGGHPNPPMWSRVLWALLEGLLAAALLLSGGLTSLQAGSLMTALPFSVILLLMCVALVKALSLDRAVLAEHERLARLERVTAHITGEVSRTHASTDEIASLVDDRIDYRLTRTRGGIGRGGHRTRVEGRKSAPSAPSAPPAED